MRDFDPRHVGSSFDDFLQEEGILEEVTAMATARQPVWVSEADYLAGEVTAEVRHEYIDGQIYAMSGASNNHNLIAGNMYAAFHAHLKGKPCRAYMSDMQVKVGSKYFYPDVMVDCSALGGDSRLTEAPVILVEVLSKSTRMTDKNIKRMAYTQIASLEAYILIEQDTAEVEVLRRSTGWQPHYYYLGDDIVLENIGLTIAVEELYDRVQNADITAWLEG